MSLWRLFLRRKRRCVSQVSKTQAQSMFARSANVRDMQPTSFPGFSPTRPPERTLGTRLTCSKLHIYTKRKLTEEEVMHQSFPAVPIPSGQPRGICSSCQSRGGAFAILSRPGGWTFDTRVFESAMDEFIGKDEAFVEQWFVRQGLDKLANVFKGNNT